jgi:hypothetical protein
MTRFRDVIWCDGCGAVERGAFAITRVPVLAPDQRDDCCPDYRDGLPYDCGERMELNDERRTGAAPDGPMTTDG